MRILAKLCNCLIHKNFHCSVYFIPDAAGRRKFGFMIPFKCCRIFEAPMNPLGDSRKYWAFFGTSPVANSNNIIKDSSGRKIIEYTLGLVGGDVGTQFTHNLDG